MVIVKLNPINKDDLKVGDVVGVAREVRCGCPDGETQCCICCDKQGGCDNRCDMMDSYEYAEECEDYVEEDES